MSSLAKSDPNETPPTMNNCPDEKPAVDDLSKVRTALVKSDSGAVAIDKSSDEWDSRSDLYGHTQIDPMYRAKAHLLNEAIADIGMGKYQVNIKHATNRTRRIDLTCLKWCLFCVAGFGWFA